MVVADIISINIFISHSQYLNIESESKRKNKMWIYWYYSVTVIVIILQKANGQVGIRKHNPTLS